MPRASVWLIRAALVHLVSGALLGASYFIWKATGWPGFAATHLGVHREQMLVGWMVQLVIGVAFWILPRTPEHHPAHAARLMAVVFLLLNAGVLTAGLGTDPALPSWLLLVGRAAESGAVVVFAAHAWYRQVRYRAAARTVLV